MSYVKAVFGLSQTKLANPDQTFKDIVRWNNQEFTKLEDELKTPQFRGIQFETLFAIPERYQDGDLYYFDASTPGIGQTGLYIRDTGSWRRL